MLDSEPVSGLTLIDALIELADPAKWARYCEMLAEMHARMLQPRPFAPVKIEPQHHNRTDYGRERLRNLSMRGGDMFLSYQEAVARQHGLGEYFDEIHRLDCEIVADFRIAGVAGRFNVTAFLDAVMENVDPRLFGVPQVRLRFDQNTIELPEGRIMYGIQIRITRQPEVSDEVAAPAIEHLPVLNAATVPSELASASAEVGTLDLGDVGIRSELRPAPDTEIHKAMTRAYHEAAEAGRKPPNIKGIVAPVQTTLRAEGYEASGRRIQELSGEDRHKSRRRKAGKTVASERRRQQP